MTANLATAREQEAPAARLNRVITNAVVRTHRRYAGRGPTRAQTFFRDNIVVVVLRETLTTGERNLAAAGREDVVHRMRQELQRAMRDDLTATIGELTGCRVTAAMSDSHIDPDVTAQLFVLDRRVPTGEPPLS